MAEAEAVEVAVSRNSLFPIVEVAKEAVTAEVVSAEVTEQVEEIEEAAVIEELAVVEVEESLLVAPIRALSSNERHSLSKSSTRRNCRD